MNRSKDLIFQDNDKNFIKYLRRTLPAGSGGGSSLPSGGTTGQVLKKASNVDNDVVWADDEGEDTFYVNTFADLPNPTTVPDKVYGVLNSSGIPYISVIFGGNYRAKGFYRSNGTEWNYLGEFPIQANQSEVDAGTVTDKFVSPATLRNSNFMSYSLSNRPLTGRFVGEVIYQTDGYFGLYYWNGSRWVSMPDGLDMYYGPYGSGGFSGQNANGGSYNPNNTSVLGIGMALFTGTSSTSGRSLQLGPVFFLSNAQYRLACEMIISFPVLSDDSNAFYTVHGAVAVPEPLRGSYFRYAHNVNGGRFECKSTNIGASYTTTDSGITVQAGAIYRLAILLTTTSVRFYINDVQVSEHTSNLSLSYIENFAGSMIQKSAGLSQRVCQILGIKYKQDRLGN